MESILDSIKQLLGPSASYPAFEPDIITHINSTFFTLHQLGVGPDTPMVISDSTTTWDAFTGIENLEAVKSYVYLKVKLIFDPPTNSALLNAIKENIAEYEWRLRSAAEIEV